MPELLIHLLMPTQNKRISSEQFVSYHLQTKNNDVTVGHLETLDCFLPKFSLFSYSVDIVHNEMLT